MTIPARTTLNDWYELCRWVWPGAPIAITQGEWDRLEQAGPKPALPLTPLLMGHRLEVLPDWPEWMP